ncbi:MAG: hypothetical protein ACKO0Z_14760 [Betaproteobacteria bacterium]
MAESAKTPDKQLEVAASATPAAPEKQAGYVVINNSTRNISIFHDGKRFEFMAQATTDEMQMTPEGAKALGESLQAFPGLIVSPVKSKAV